MKTFLTLMACVFALSGVAQQPFGLMDRAFISRSDWKPTRISGLKLWVESSQYVLTSISPDVSATNGQTIARWKDLSGQGNNLSQTSAGLKPSLIIVSGLPCVRFNLAHSLASSAFSGGTLSQPVTMIIAAAITNVSGGAFITDGITSGNRVCLMNAGGGTSPALYALSSVVQALEFTLIGDKAVWTCIFNGTNLSRIWKNGFAADATAGLCDNGIGAGNLTGFTLGSAYNQTQYFTKADVYGVLLFSGVLSRADRRLCEGYFARKFAIPVQPIPDRILMFSGDSLTSGFGLSVGQDYPSQCVGTANWTYEKHNFGVSGATVASSYGSVFERLATFGWGGSKAICPVWYGSNDLNAGNSAAQMEADISGYLGAVRTAGFLPIVVSVLPRGGAMEARRITYNAWLSNNWQTVAGAFADVAFDSRIGAPGANMDTNYYQTDAIHLNAVGAGIAAGIVRQAINSITP